MSGYRPEVRQLGKGVMRHRILHCGKPLNFGQVLLLWQEDPAFVDVFAGSLADSPYAAYRWETPALKHDGQSVDFEYVLVNAPYLQGQPDRLTYADHFRGEVSGEGVVVFENLGRDAVLVVPTPLSEQSDYAHLAAFMRSAPRSQVRSLWSAVGRTALAQLSGVRESGHSGFRSPVWINTAGGGVYWTHVRVDARPKYYAHRAYARPG